LNLGRELRQAGEAMELLIGAGYWKWVSSKSVRHAEVTPDICERSHHE